MKRIVLFLLSTLFISPLQGDIQTSTDIDAIQDISQQEIFLEKAQAYQKDQNYQSAINYYQRAFALEPGTLQAHFSLAYCCTMLGQSALALATYKTILKKYPTCISVLYNMAYILKMEDEIDKALPFYKKTLELDPNREESHFGLGMAYLVKGDFKNGWDIHERYLKRTKRNAETFRTYLKDNTIAGKTLLLRPEGGLGDTIQFLRYAKKLKQLGVHVVVSVQKELFPLVCNCDYIDKLLKTGDRINVTYDDCTTLMSIPAIWYQHYQEIVQEIPYIHPDPALTLYWYEQLKTDTNFKIGICWGASIHNDSSRAPVAHRSIPLEMLYMLHDIPGVSLYSLQRFDGEEQLDDLPDNIIIRTFGEDFDKTFGPFMDSAAIIQNLDLVISVDTAMAHLAGALGKRVFVMLPYSTDWRWIAHRTDSPWYPTMQIFKQPKPFDWQSVVERVYDAVKEKIKEQ